MKRGMPIETVARLPTPANSSITTGLANARPLSPTTTSEKTTLEVIFTSINATEAIQDGVTTTSYMWSSPKWQASYPFGKGLSWNPAESDIWSSWRTDGAASDSVSTTSTQSLVLSPSGSTVSTVIVNTNSPSSTLDSTASPSAIPTQDSLSTIPSAFPTSSASVSNSTQPESTLPNTTGDQQSMAAGTGYLSTTTTDSWIYVYSLHVYSTTSGTSWTGMVLVSESLSTSSSPVNSNSEGTVTSTPTLEPWQTVTKTSPITTTTAVSTIVSSSHSSDPSKTTEYSHATTKSQSTFSESITSINTAGNTSSSSSKDTAASSSTPQLVTSLHPTIPTSRLSYVLPITLSLGISLLLVLLFLTYRRKFPEHYVKTEKYCPIRRPINFVKNLPPFLALRERRERNRGIKERQQRYMNRRSRARMWPVTPCVVGPSGTERSVRDTAQDRDEWLRSDMLGYYGEKESSGASSVNRASLLPGTVVSGDDDGNVSSFRRSGSDASRSAWDEYFEAGMMDRPTSPRSIASPRVSTAMSRLSMPPVRPLSGILQPMFSSFQNADTYKPGQPTGDRPGDTPIELESTRRVREMVRAQREKVLRDEGIEGRSSLSVTWHDDKQREGTGDFARKGGN